MRCQYGNSTLYDVDAHGHLVTVDALPVDLLLHSEMILMSTMDAQWEKWLVHSDFINVIVTIVY